jgi:dTDP-4-dehydrorhamnose reductase
VEKILVTGAGGQLGRELQALAGSHQARKFIFTGHQDLPVEDPAAVQAFFQEHRPQWCINCAAFTAVDKAESEKAAAFRINGDAPGFLAAACRSHQTKLIHISTDYVFKGNSATPLKEDDPTGPINVYGASKLEGEHQALDHYRKGTIIIRTSWVYSQFGNNFVRTMIRLMQERPSIGVVDDQIGSPTYAADLANALLRIIIGPRFLPGIFHYSNEGSTSWYQFAQAIKEELHIRNAPGSNCTVNPIPTSDYPTPAARPRYSLLDKSLIKSTYKLSIPDWRSSLNICMTNVTKVST